MCSFAARHLQMLAELVGSVLSFFGLWFSYWRITCCLPIIVFCYIGQYALRGTSAHIKHQDVSFMCLKVHRIQNFISLYLFAKLFGVVFSSLIRTNCSYFVPNSYVKM